MFYDRKIRYLNYYEGGERVRGSGFVKLEARDNTLRFDITVKGLRDTEGVFPIFLCGNDREERFEQLVVKEGHGEHRYTCGLKNGIGGTGIPYGGLTGIRIPLAGEKEIACRWDEASLKRTAGMGALPQAEPGGDAARDGEELSRQKEPQGCTARKNAKPLSQDRQDDAVRGSTGEPEKESVWKTPEDTAGERAQSGRNVLLRAAEGGKEGAEEEGLEERGKTEAGKAEISKPIRLQEDKWAQLCAIYPHIKPFRDEREYLSISPADFVLLPAADYRAAHNSFLLHGYYNYHHLILTRVEKRGEILYYLGVPGNYFEKEKQVAVMFGFESFECAEEPAEYGDFGYYMMRTEI